MVGVLAFFSLTFAFFILTIVFEGQPSSVGQGNDYMIELATIEPDRPKVRKVVKKEPVKKREKPKVTKHPLYDDCVETLVTLGENKGSAQRQVKAILESREVKNLEHFVRIAFSNKV